jgi:hypothetical protein
VTHKVVSLEPVAEVAVRPKGKALALAVALLASPCPTALPAVAKRRPIGKNGRWPLAMKHVVFRLLLVLWPQVIAARSVALPRNASKQVKKLCRLQKA